MNESKNLIITYCCLGAMAIAFVVSKAPLNDTAKAQNVDTAPSIPAVTGGTNPRLLKLNLSLSTPEDLKVKAGDSVSNGQVLVEKTLIKQGCDLNMIELQRDRKTILVELIPRLAPTSRS